VFKVVVELLSEAHDGTRLCILDDFLVEENELEHLQDKFDGAKLLKLFDIVHSFTA